MKPAPAPAPAPPPPPPSGSQLEWPRFPPHYRASDPPFHGHLDQSGTITCVMMMLRTLPPPSSVLSVITSSTLFLACSKFHQFLCVLVTQTQEKIPQRPAETILISKSGRNLLKESLKESGEIPKESLRFPAVVKICRGKQSPVKGRGLVHRATAPFPVALR